MEPNTNISRPKASAKDFFLNLGAIVALGTVVGYLIDLLFTIIEKAYPVIGYTYYSDYSISWPVATLIIFFPVYVLLMWLLERDYKLEPERRHVGVRKWLTYLTLFLAGLAAAGDLVTVLYYFINGNEITTGFIMKIIVVLVISVAIFFYYISDVLGKLNSTSRKIWAGVSVLLIAGSIVWGFSVLGSPRAQQLLRYDEQKVSDLTNINSQIESFYSTKNILPATLSEVSSVNYGVIPVDPQSGSNYEYSKVTNTTYKLCAQFNSATPDATSPNIYARPVGYQSWVHPVGHFCFDLTINPNLYAKPVPVK